MSRTRRGKSFVSSPSSSCRPDSYKHQEHCGILNSGVEALAKRRKKKMTLKSTMKYELYGILLLIFSVIALSGEASVGSSLSKLSGCLLGKFYFFIPLLFIYIGLYVMIQRAWP